MNRPFCLVNRTIRIYKYSVTYTGPVYDVKTLEQVGEETVVEGFVDYDEAKSRADEMSGVCVPLDTTDFEWIDGVVVPKSDTPMAEAIKIYNMGREAWEAKQNAPSAEDRMAQMEADIAYLAMLTDTDMEV